MSKSETPHSINRRSFIGAGAGLGVAGLSIAQTVSGDPPVDKFLGRKPMKPAPSVIQAISPAPPLAALVLNKAAYGPRPGDIEAFIALGGNDNQRLANWVDEQLNPTVADPEIDARLQALLDSTEPLDQLAYDTIDPNITTAEQLWTDYARHETYAIRNRPVWQMERLTLLRAAYSKWQLREVLYDFWFNHFNVFGREFPTSGMMPNYDAVLRGHIFGNFSDMLNANAKTASMLYYLDNYTNTWPNPNENYAREVMELHTLGAVNNYYGAVDPESLDTDFGLNEKGQRRGYTEIDVFELAKALTGWGVSDTTDSSPDTGAFIFRPNRHYNNWQVPIKVLDVELTETNGEADITEILDYLAGHFGTAQYIAWKLCTRLIGDNPPQGIVDSTADEFYNRRDQPDQLKEVYRHVLDSNEFLTTWGAKVTRPVETLVRAWRASGVDLTMRVDDSESNNIWNRLDDTGHFPFGYAPPTGFPDEREMWQGSGPLIMSWRVVTFMLRRDKIVNQAAQTNANFTLEADRSTQNIVGWWINRALGYDLPVAHAERIVQYVTDILAILDPGFMGDYATETLETFMDTVTVTNVDGTAKNSTYQRIIRGVVGLILMSPDSMRR